jgi:ribA/ribD-fused uncharacterized protein
MNSKFVFYSKSADAFPGKGKNEFLTDSDKINGTFKDLHSINHWRRMLSNFHESKFTYDNLTFNTAEHAFHYSKFKLFDEKIAFTFTLESESDLSKGNGNDARKARKLIVLNEEQLSKWARVRANCVNNILYAKFSQSVELQTMLKNTKQAELWHYLGRGYKAGENLERWEYLENLRNSCV